MKLKKLGIATLLVVAMLAIGGTSAFASQTTTNILPIISVSKSSPNIDAIVTTQFLNWLKTADLSNPAVVSFLDSLKKPDSSNPTIIISKLLGAEPYWIVITAPDGTVYYIDPAKAMY
jgi:hypothetical protein